MAYTAHRFAGLDTDVWLPDDIEVIVDIVPAKLSNIRSNQRYTAQDRIIYHETGNTAKGATARSERNWLHSGAAGAYVGYNFAVDDKQIFQLTPLDEVTWSAGVASWNKRAWAVEQCVGGGVDLDRARRNAAALHGALCAAKGWNPVVAVVQHNTVYGKNCPAIIRRSGLWGNVMGMIGDAFTASRAAAAGGKPGTPTVPVYAKPAPIPELDAISMSDGVAPAMVDGGGTTWIWVGDTVEAIRDTPRLQYADPKSANVGPVIPKGARFAVDWLTLFEGAWWYYTPFATRVRAEDTERISDSKAA